jgi:glycosyltransferase involved in cell wall biosynthesis
VRITFVLWDGFIGGAERFTASLAAEIQAQGTATSVVFVGKGQPLSAQLDRDSVPFRALGFSRGSHLLRHPHLLARTVTEDGADVVIIGGFGYLGALLRAGGFRGPLLGVEHGVLHQLPGMPWHKRTLRCIDRALGVPTHDIEIAVSRYMENLARDTLHGRRLVRIPHGVSAADTRMGGPPAKEGAITVGYAGRLYDGKGVDVLLHAIALAKSDDDAQPPYLRVAGDGPARVALEALASRLEISGFVTFLGWTDDLAQFWDGCDVAVAPASTLAESFSMTTLEAMARGRATIVTERGALPELVVPGRTGAVVPAGDASALASAIAAYASAPDTIKLHGEAAQKLARERFSLNTCARAYVELTAEALETRQSRGPRRRRLISLGDRT